MSSTTPSDLVRSKEGPGHLFIVQGDLTNLICDAWLLPTDKENFVEPKPWLEALEKHWDAADIKAAIDSLDLGEVRSQPLESFTRDGRCVPWLTDIADYADPERNRACEGVSAFIQAAGEKAKTSESRLCLAMPVVGTGKGGWNDSAGQLLLELVTTVLKEIEGDGKPDVILVVHQNPKMFAAAQLARERTLKERESSGWPGLSPELREVAASLADKALDEELVVFIGAGASRPAGLPGWVELLEKLAVEVGIDVDDDFRSMAPLDRAWLIERTLEELNDGRDLGDLVSEKFPDDKQPALSHQLIASLPVREFVTTNYDRLFEEASEGVGMEAVSITSIAPRADSRWLLKLHGSSENPESIVLSRNDYLNYANRRAALAGIVQAMLLTRHMLFVGFSLSDDNFLKIAHDVQNAIGERPHESKPVGTALWFGSEEPLAKLWKGFIDVKSVDKKESDGRGLEIFLDWVVARSVTRNMAFLLAPTFDALLSDDDREVRNALKKAAESISETNQSDAAVQFEQTLSDLGQDST